MAVLQERARIARELHDGVSQTLYAITLGASRALTHLQQNERTDVQRLIDTGLTGQAVLLWLFTVAMPKVADPGRPPLATGGDPIVATASRWLQASGLAAPQPQQQKVAA